LPPKITNRVGETSKNAYSSVMKITKYNTINDIEVTFDNGFVTHSYYDDFKKGSISNPLDKTCCNIGYFGVGKYDSKNKAYSIWRGIIERCYDEKSLKKYTTYIGCSVCDEWHNYQNFAKWFENNYYEIKGQEMHIDKDILFKENKIYSPETCVFVPKEINVLFVRNNKRRGIYPIGVYLSINGERYVAHCYNKKPTYLGTYDTPEEAFEAYKDYKEDVIKGIADKYYGLIPDKLYKAMYDYVVEITD